MHNFRELKIWQNARQLVKDIYIASFNFPAEEKFGLTSQIRKSAVSIPSNIAEGSGRGTDKDFSNFINISLGSAFELETQIILAYDLEFIEKIQLNSLTEKVQEIQKMLFGLHKKLSTT